MNKFDALYYDTEGSSTEEFSMEKPTLPEERQKTSGWIVKGSDIRILDIDQYYMGA